MSISKQTRAVPITTLLFGSLNIYASLRRDKSQTNKQVANIRGRSHFCLVQKLSIFNLLLTISRQWRRDIVVMINYDHL